MSKDLQKKQNGLINLGEIIPVNRSGSIKREELNITEEHKKAFFYYMSNPRFLNQGPKIIGNPNAVYTF